MIPSSGRIPYVAVSMALAAAATAPATRRLASSFRIVTRSRPSRLTKACWTTSSRETERRTRGGPCPRRQRQPARGREAARRIFWLDMVLFLLLRVEQVGGDGEIAEGGRVVRGGKERCCEDGNRGERMFVAGKDNGVWGKSVWGREEVCVGEMMGMLCTKEWAEKGGGRERAPSMPYAS